MKFHLPFILIKRFFAPLAVVCVTAAADTEIVLTQGSVSERQSLIGNVTYKVSESCVFTDISTLTTAVPGLRQGGGGVFMCTAQGGPKNEWGWGTLIFEGTGSNNQKLEFVNCSIQREKSNSTNEGGGAIQGDTVVFQNLSDILFSSCFSKTPLKVYANAGGAVNFNSAGFFSHVGNVSFVNNFCEEERNGGQSLGGAVFANGLVSFEYTKNILFEGNKATIFNKGAASGGAIYTAGSYRYNTPIPRDLYVVSFNNIDGSVVFRNNLSQKGGAICANDQTINGKDSGGGILWKNIAGDVVFEKNQAICFAEGWSVQGGAVYSMSGMKFQNIKGNVIVSDNMAEGVGGGFYTKSLILRDTGKVLFSRNKASVNAGGVEVLNDFEISANRGDVLFSDNEAGNSGGAIGLNMGDALFSADGGDIVFSGNREKRGGELPVLNAIVIRSDKKETATLTSFSLRAKRGHEIVFYDPIRNATSAACFDDIVFELNKPSSDSASLVESMEQNGNSYEGTIRFSGEEADRLIVRDEEKGESEQEWRDRVKESKYNRISGKTSLYGGRLVLEQGAIYGDEDLSRQSSFESLGSAVLEIKTGGILNANEVRLSGDTLMRNGSGGMMSARTIDFSQGLIFDFRPWLNDRNSGLHIRDAESLVMGGRFRVEDRMFDYYGDKCWGSEQRFLVISLGADALGGVNGDFEGTFSLLTGSQDISSPYTYEGTWSKEWVDTDGDGVNDELYAVWIPKKNVIDPGQPEVPGDAWRNT